jgi:redox-sensing transcriptional repressor
VSPKLGVPRPSLSRLPLYYRFLVEAAGRGETVVSSDEMGQALGLPPAQIRKDLSYLREFGRPGVGYHAGALAGRIEELLGLASDKEAIVVGAGRLGQALAAYPGFAAYGLRIVALFDNDPVRIGQEVAGGTVFPLSRLQNLVPRLNVQMGIITVPADAAQQVADAMVEAGITAIWNFAPVRLVVPEGVWVENEDLASRLAMLSYHLAGRRPQPAGAPVAGEGR